MLAPMPATPEPKRTITQLRVEPDLWQRIKDQAKRRRMSANSYVLAAVERQVVADERDEA